MSFNPDEDVIVEMELIDKTTNHFELNPTVLTLNAGNSYQQSGNITGHIENSSCTISMTTTSGDSRFNNLTKQVSVTIGSGGFVEP